MVETLSIPLKSSEKVLHASGLVCEILYPLKV